MVDLALVVPAQATITTVLLAAVDMGERRELGIIRFALESKCGDE